MTSSVRRLFAAAALTVASFSPLSHAEPPVQPPQQVATVEQLKAEAFQALRAGEFHRVSDLIGRAAALSNDPSLVKMSDWASSYQKQLEEFRAERRKSYEAEVEKVQKLLAQDMPDYALRTAVMAYTYAEDKDAFRGEPWVVKLLETVTQRAEQYEQAAQWLKAVRLYSDLVVVEPFNPEWKEHQKLAFRRVRLLMLYTPDFFKEIQLADAEERRAADEILSPATQPATRPSDEQKDEEETLADAFKMDWRDSLSGAKTEMLRDALDNARVNYWRDIGYGDLMTGGLKGIRALLTTAGLEKAFPKLGDPALVKPFLEVVDEHAASVANGGPADRAAMQRLLQRLQVVNTQTVELPEEVIAAEFADGAFSELDQFSQIFWPTEFEEFNKQTTGEFSGVGIQIQSDPADGGLKVVSPLEDSPAFRAGIRAGDIITRINGKSAKGVSTNQAVKIITGPPGTTVALTIRTPKGEERDVTLRRQTIKVASVKGWMHLPGGGWDYMVDPDNKIGYLRLTSFARDTARDMRSALGEMKSRGAQAVVLDLRGNGGGLLTAAADVSDAFLSDGKIVSTRSDREDDPNQPVINARRNADDNTLPLVVLVNQQSASASEIVSGALKDHKRAAIVGERTFGKGSVQMLFPLANRTAALKLTTSHYYLPNGRCIHREESSTEWGVDPNFVVEMTPEQMRAVFDARSQLDVLHDDAATPETDHVAALRKSSEQLLASDPQLNAALLILRMHLNGAPLL
jgi:carboxyl-terminal processing protease